MPSVFTLKALGLNTMPNQLEVPEGSLTVAKNVTIQRDGVLESRRGFKIYGDSFGFSFDRAKQLITYKQRILRHFSSTLQYDNGSGTFSNFTGSVVEAQSGLRIKSIEANGNLYFTTAEGIKKISAKTADDFSSIANTITDAGAAKAVDITGRVIYAYGDQTSFLPQDSAVAYRVVWGTKDNNGNLLLGTPSQRIEVYNYLQTLLLQDYMKLLSALDTIGTLGSMISDANYVNTLKLAVDASASDLLTNLISLCSKLDNDILYADTVAAPLQIASAGISGGICTVTFSSGNPTLYFSGGSKIYLSGFAPGTSGTLDGAQVISSVTATTITFNTTATGVVTLTAPTIVSNSYRTLVTPTTPAVPPTNDDLLAIQDYILSIITQLTLEPNAIIADPISAQYIDILDVTTSASVKLQITVPSNITSNYFFQIYRSSIFEATNTQVLSLDVFPNDELQLVYEAYPTSAELASKTITVIDVVPDDFRGANLYTNASTGEGILQANDVPPFAKDINVFKNSVFYANTYTRYRLAVSLLGIQSMIADYDAGNIPSLTVATTSGYNTYTFIKGKSEIFDITCVAGGALASSGTASYFDVYGGSDQRSYRFWYKIGSAVAPSDGGHTLVQILATAGDTAAVIAQRTRDALNIISEDFNASIPGAGNIVHVELIVSGYTTDPSVGTSGYTILVTQQGQGESVTNKQILLSSNISPAIAVQETAQSLTRVLNANPSENIYVYYTSGAQEVPGQMVFESRSLNNAQFSILTNNTNTGDSFNPTFAPKLQISSITTGSPTTMTVVTSSPHGLINLDYVYISGSNSTPSIDGYQQITYVDATTFRVNATVTIAGNTGGVSGVNDIESASNEASPNRVYYSKFQQPEAVPILNYFEVGAKDKAILRIFPLRDSLFVFKEDGLYRISGESIPFNLALFDTSCVLVAPDSVSSVDNVIYGWTRQGVTSVTESGTRNVSRPIDVGLLPLSSAAYTNFATATWGVGYESDKSYTVFTIKKSSDVYAQQGFKYNTLTNTWTSIDKDYVCGVINFIDDKMYVGAGDTNYIEQERKSFTREDYADREYNLSILPNSVSNYIFVSSISSIAVNDVIVQEQTLTSYLFNMLLKKLDSDPGIPSSDYFTSLESTVGDNLRNKLVLLAQKLDADGLTFTDYAQSIANLSGVITNISTGSNVIVTSANHGLITGRKILISGTNSTPNIDGEYTVNVINANTFSISTGFTVTTTGSSGGFLTVVSDFEDLKICYNKIMTKLNIDPTVSFSNYALITNNTIQESIISAIDVVTKKITIGTEIPFIQGAFKIYKAIPCEVIYSPNTFGGDPSSLKHIREAQLMFDNLAFTKGIISFATDLLPMFEPVEFNADGNGIFGFTPFGEGFFGGASHGAPIRTYIPRNTQRCRYMIIKFNHQIAREKWSLYGISLTGETQLSSRAYK